MTDINNKPEITKRETFHFEYTSITQDMLNNFYESKKSGSQYRFTLWSKFFYSFNCLIYRKDELTNIENFTYVRVSLKAEPSD